MRVWLIRHSNAVEAGRFDGADADRPLTGEGNRRARRFFRSLASLHPRPDVVIASEAVRARETADFFCRAFELSRFRIDAALNPDAPARCIVQIIRRHRKTCPFLVIIGHEPALSGAASQLTSAGHLSLKLRKCGLVELEIPSRGKPVLLGLQAPR